MYIDNLQKECCDLHYSIIFMDIEMPIMNGYQASKLIKEAYWTFKEIEVKRQDRREHSSNPEDILDGKQSKNTLFKLQKEMTDRPAVIWHDSIQV